MHSMKNCYLILLCFASLITINVCLAQNLKASAVKVNITPEIPKFLLGYGERESIGVHDSIYHKIVILDDGISKFYLVSTDVCVVSPGEYDRVASLLSDRFNIDPLHFWWTATHTHSAPEMGPPGLPEIFMSERYDHEVDTAYSNYITEKLIEGISIGLAKMVPVRLGVGWGHSQANINRRAKDVDQLASLGMNPDGPVDRRIGLLKIIKQSDENLLAMISNYPIHGTVLGGENLHISGDAPGVVSKYVEEKLGAPLLFINGAAGNIAPIYSVYPNPIAGHLSQFRTLLGDKIIDAQEHVQFFMDSIKLTFGELIFETPLKEGLEWPSDLSKYISSLSEGQNMVKVPVRFLAINEEIGIWGSPLELFCEISNEVRDRSPFPYTFFYGYTNGWLGYMLSEKEEVHKGYESTVSPFGPKVGRAFTEAVSSYFQSELISKSKFSLKEN